MAEFLPLCDLLFNIVSLAAYFCDVVFDLLMVYTLYGHGGPTVIFAQCLAVILLSSVITQLVSIHWHFERQRATIGARSEDDDGEPRTVSARRDCDYYMVILLHMAQMAMLWRYAKLLAPVKLDYVKRDVRDLCVLRLIHAFVQAAPMLLLQLSLLPAGGDTGGNTAAAAVAAAAAVSATALGNTDIAATSVVLGNGAVATIPTTAAGAATTRSGLPADLITVSAALSLFSVCWALASFSKHVQTVDRLILTWLGVVSQLLWRAGTVTARALALSAYAASYHSWIFLVLALHWSCMFLWLVSPRSAFYGEKGKRLGLCMLLAGVYVLTYVNLQNKPHVRTMTVFYVVMLLENALLVTAWLAAVWPVRPAHWVWVPVLTIGLFLIGLFFMVLYYRYFHVRRLLETKPTQPPGVFNCRFASSAASAAAAAALYRKKKKPTSFVPPPGLSSATNPCSAAATLMSPPHHPSAMTMTAIPFWRRPLPSSSENECSSSVGSRSINIHQKLQEKKQKQLAELKIIEEEIKQGKLVGPALVPDDNDNENGEYDDDAGDGTGTGGAGGRGHCLHRGHRAIHQPIPRAKRHLDHQPQLMSLASLNNLASYGVNLNRRPPPPPRAAPGIPPELLLAPRYLYYDCAAPPPEPEHIAVQHETGAIQMANGSPIVPNGVGGGSDIESQLSLPRSYTLPREFKYLHRRAVGGSGAAIRRPLTAAVVASTNSSDGDVDSADDDDSDYNARSGTGGTTIAGGGVSGSRGRRMMTTRHHHHLPTSTVSAAAQHHQVLVRPLRRPYRHETKL